tara:strand:- start:4712 stop:5608 length:897 start_codon:yes stop_codon:yes gene_type:complete
MPDEYGNIEVTTEELSGLSKVDDTPTPKESDPVSEPSVEEVNEEPREESVESAEPQSTSDSEEEYELHVGDDVYSIDQVLEWKANSDNKSDWSKSNTQKAQAIAKGGRLLEQLDNDEAFREYVKEYFYGDEKEFGRLGLDSRYGVDFDKVPQQEQVVQETQEPQDDPRLNQLFDRIEGLEDEKLERSIGDRFDDIKANNPNFFKEENDGVDFLQFCNDKGVINEDDIDMEASFKLWSYDKVMTQENRAEQLHNNRLRNEGSVINDSEVGAKEVRSGKPIKDYKEITMDNPEITRYFNT